MGDVAPLEQVGYVFAFLVFIHAPHCERINTKRTVKLIFPDPETIPCQKNSPVPNATFDLGEKIMQLLPHNTNSCFKVKFRIHDSPLSTGFYSLVQVLKLTSS